MKSITSRDNPLFKTLKKYARTSRARREAGVMLLDGIHLLDACPRLDTVIVDEEAQYKPEIAAWLAAHGQYRSIGLPAALFKELAVVDTPSGIMALAPQPQPASAPLLDADALLLDGVQDPGNLGSLLRSAAAAGVKQALLSSGCAHAWSPRALRAGQGAHFLLDIHEDADLPAFLTAYGGLGAVTTLDGSQPLYAVDLARQPVAWAFGAEGQGVSAAVLAAARLRVRIPMPGGVESLNVAAAAAVCLFETLRQRQC